MFGVQQDGEPIGAAVFEVKHASDIAHITYLEIRSAAHFTEALQLLLEELERTFIDQGMNAAELSITFSGNEEPVNRLFERNGWNQTNDRLTKYIAGPNKAVDLQWMKRLKRHERYRTVPWSDKEDRAVEVILKSEDIWFPRNFSPLYERKRSGGEISMALYDGDDLSGWIICEKVVSNMMFGKNFFVKKSPNAKAAAMILLADFIEKGLASGCYFTFYVKSENQGMHNIVQRRLREAIIHERKVVRFVWKVG